MAEPTKIVKGGFRATLALVISVIAFFISIFAYTTSQNEKDLNARLQDFQSKFEKMKAESAEQIKNPSKMIKRYPRQGLRTRPIR